MGYINDQLNWKLSNLAYNRGKQIYNPNPDWEVIEPEGALLHDTNGSGFDATVFKNTNTDDIIIAYRGTEPPGRPLWSMLMDYGTDGMDVVGGRIKGLEEFHQSYEKIKDNPWILSQPEAARTYQKMEYDYQTNQFHQAEELYRTVRTAYPNAQITTTGHSLGGAEAEYVAVRNGLSSTTFNAPSINHLLSDELQEKSNRGVFDKTNVSYVDPGDAIGSGLREADRHVGSTFYTYSTYEEANKRYQYSSTAYYPLITTEKRANSFQDFLFGPEFRIKFVPVTYDLVNFGVVSKFFNSIMGEGTHALERFEFDEAGNISNALFTMDGEPISGSPRLQYYEESMANQTLMKEAVQDLIARYGSNWGKFGTILATATGVKIQLRPEALKEAGQTLNRHVQEFQAELPSAIRSIQHLVETSSSRSLQPIAERLTQTLLTFNRWYVGEGQQIADYINKKADDFIRADQG